MKKQLFNYFLAAFCMSLFSAFQAYAQPTPTGYEPPTPITDSVAYKCANYFKDLHDDHGIPISGGIITREALDLILKTTNCNAITFKFCQDPNGKIGTPSTIFLVVSGANVTGTNGNYTVNPINAPKYNSNDWCPPSCMKFMIKDASGQLREVE